MNRQSVELAANEPTHDRSLPLEQTCQHQTVPQSSINNVPSRLEQLQNISATQHSLLRSADEPGTIEGEAYCLCRDRTHVRIVRSEDLLQGHRELMIVHGQEVYRLLCTRNNKLILQK
ncbi:MAG: hemin uptake protein HemP [Pirellulaceae bacterium]